MTVEKMAINGVTYAYRWLCQSDFEKPTLVCLHGFTGTMSNFTFSTDHLNILGIDLIGHGNTDTFVHPDRYQLSSLVTDLAQLVAKLEIDSFYLLGYSMGARTALAWMVEQPKGILGVILEGGTPGIGNITEKKERQNKDNMLAQRLLTDSLGSFVDHWEALPLFNSQRKLPMAIKKRIRQERMSQQPFGLALSLMCMGTGQQENYWPSLASINLPVVYLAGEYDVKFQEIGKKFTEQNKLFSFIQVAGSGHCIHLEQPKVFESLILEWVAEVEAT